MDCTRINCPNEATLQLSVRVPLGNTGKTFDQELPYCDNDFGWFYRSMSRKSYNVEVIGITVLLDLDEQFKNLV